MMAEGMGLYDGARLTRIGRRLFLAAGTTEENAARVTESLVEASLVGHDSHGVIRIPQYLASIASGDLLPAARPEVVRDTGAGILVNGNWTFGQVSCAEATRLAVERARHSALAVAGVVRCTHTGRLGEYAEQAAAEGMILLAFGGGLTTNPLAAPFGGRIAALGANPIAMGFPLESGREPMILDFATTVIAEGKIRVARAAGAQLAPGSILDRDGQPSTDPNAFYDGGTLLPFGGHKGYALALAAELLAAALLSAGDWAEEGRGGKAFGRSGALFLAIDPAVLGTREEYLRNAAATLALMKEVPPAPGFTEVLTPGEPERRARRQRLREGVPLAEATWESLRAAAAELGVSTD